MKKLSLIISCLLLFSTIFSSCKKKKDDPAPTTSSTTAKPVVVSAGLVNSSYTLGSTTYNTTGGSQETYKQGSNDFYILTATDNTGNTFCEFWFSNKPTTGTYTITSFLNGFTYGFGSNVGVAASSGSSSNSSQYYSQNYLTPTTLDVSLNGTALVVSVSGLSLQNANTSSDIRSFSTTSTFP